MTTWGVGVDGSLGPRGVAELGALAESCSYRSFWFNVIRATVHPADTVKHVLAATRNIEIGVGVVPIDEFPASDLAARFSELNLGGRRLVLGIASGQMKGGAVASVESAIAHLHQMLPGVSVALGAYGPKMLALGGRSADAMNLNWMTPDRLDWARALIGDAARDAGRAMPDIYLYHRAAVGPGAAERISAEMARYRDSAVHERHQEAMGNPEYIGVVAESSADVSRALDPYSGNCLPILRPLPSARTDLEEWRHVLGVLRPR